MDRIEEPTPNPLQDYHDRVKREEKERRARENERRKWDEWWKSQQAAKAQAKETNPKDAIGQTKIPMHLVSGIVKVYQAIAHYLGNIKYGAWNYRAKGARASVYVAALHRHIDAWWEGEDNDPVDGTPHLANALACINILIETSVRGNMVDDRPPKSEYREVVKKMEALMPQINERYKHMRPTNYYDKGENL
jgi:hypothetical protein